MLSEFEKKMLSLTGVNNDSKTKQLMNFMATQHSRKVYISEDEYKNTLLGTWLKKNGLDKEEGGNNWETNTNYLLKMSKQAILKYANYFKENDLADVYLLMSYAKNHRVEPGENEFGTEGADESDVYAFDFYYDDGVLAFYYGIKSGNVYENKVTISDIIENPLNYIELEFEYYEGSEVYSEMDDYTIFDYIAINEPQRQYIDDRGLFEIRNGEDGHFYALVLSYVDETSIKYLVFSHTGAITLFDPENDGFMSLEDLETVDESLNANEIENLITNTKSPAILAIVNQAIEDNDLPALVNLLTQKASLSGAAFTGNITAPSIIENMAGYSYSSSTSTYPITRDITYIGAVKNGNKLTLVNSQEITRLDTIGDGIISLGSFNIPIEVGNKLIPVRGNWLAFLEVYCASDYASGTTLKALIIKDTATSLRCVLYGCNTLTLNTKYYIRLESTFLLSNNLAE